MVKLWRLGLISFNTASKIQAALARKHLDGLAKGVDANCDTLLLVEHKPIYTVGIRDNTPKNEIQRLRSMGADFQKTNRGGLITFHGPGQLVAYPVINLKHYKPSVKWYVNSLEETVIQMCGDLGITAGRSPHTGVWVQDYKIAAIGIHASRYVTTHGIALNCDTDLTWFENIEPCGIPDKGVTSISKEMGRECSVEEMTPLFLNSFKEIFGCKLEEINSDIQTEILSSVYSNLFAELTNN